MLTCSMILNRYAILCRDKVSRQHCELYPQNEMLWLRDVSTSGTIVGKKRIQKESISVEGRTSVFVADDAVITVTPCDMNATVCASEREKHGDDSSEERRENSDRRTLGCRQNDPDSNVAEFERRCQEVRGTNQRRVA